MKIPATLATGEIVYIVDFLGPSPVYAVYVGPDGHLHIAQLGALTVLPWEAEEVPSSFVPEGA